jgi:glycosyltransferase involved in cell wall biosynthesis
MTYLLYSLIVLRVSYWIFIFSKLALFKINTPLNHSEGVSIIVCVKNNSSGIIKLLSKLIKQNHKNYEVIVVDDFSSDGLEEKMAPLISQHIKYIKASMDMPGKKAALTTGIDVASKQWILVTDSDCIPSSLNWISLMIGSAIDQKKEIVLGYAPMSKKNGLAPLLSKYETAYVGMQYLAYTLAKKSYMGVGRNMLFKKALFLESRPFEYNMHIASGDDDLFIQKAASLYNIGICIDADAQCYSDPKHSMNEYIIQKTRHTSTSNSYKNEHKLMLGFFGFLHISIYFLMAIGWMFNLIKAENIIAAWLLMLAVITTIQLVCYTKLNEQKTMMSFIVSDFLLSLLYSIVGIRTLFAKNIKWN